MTEKSSMMRSVLVAVLLLAVLVVLSVRLGHLHLGNNDELWEMVTSRQSVEKQFLFGRGKIVDRHGQLLAFERPAKHVIVSPVDIQNDDNVDRAADVLSQTLGTNRWDVLQILKKPGRYYEMVQRFVPDELAEQINDHHIRGITFKDARIRVYPLREQFAHVLGFANWEGIGSAGIEQRLDIYLRGTPGLLQGRRDRRSRELRQHRSLDIASQKGADVELTIDRNIQNIVEEALSEAVDTHHAKGGWAIVQDVRTGEILGMASRPTYDPMSFLQSEAEDRRNQAISTVFEPGSTMKVLTIASALEKGVVTRDTKFDCEKGMWYFAGRPLRDHHAYGMLDVADILKKSSNIGTAKIAVKLGAKGLEESLRSFGIGSKTRIDLPGEEFGIFYSRKRWSKVSISRIPMGQGIAVTALQMVNAVSAIANDGYLMRPRIVRRVIHRNGNTILDYEPEVIGRPVGSDTAKVMRELMTRVTEPGGTGTRAAMDGYPVAGKTGTAQKPENKGYSDSKHIASFVGFVPSDEPRLSIIVVIDEPQPIHSGGVVAAPAWKSIAERALPYLGVQARHPSFTGSHNSIYSHGARYLNGY